MKNLQRTDLLLAFVLAALATFIWLRDLSWTIHIEDTLPILIAMPLFIWLGWPWDFKDETGPFSKGWIAAVVVLFLLGIILDMTLLLALSWTTLLWTWLSQRLHAQSRSTALKLMILPLMAFPWVALDAEPIGWWFRYSGAWTTAHVFELMGANVQQVGTNLLINGTPISVEAACAGLNTLQTMLIAGTVVAYALLRDTPRYWWSFPQLIAITWVANTVRIIVISFIGLIVSVAFAMGAFHTWGGWIVVTLTFALCWIVFSLQEKKP